MADIDTEFVDALEAVELSDGRVYPLSFPQGATFPLLTYQRISAPREQTMDRTIAETRTRFQIDCWATSYAVIRAFVTQVIAAVLAFRGTTVPVRWLGIEGERDDYNVETGLFRTILDVVVVHG